MITCLENQFSGLHVPVLFRALLLLLIQNCLLKAALKELYEAQQEMSNWAASKNKPGQFTGHTGAKILSKGELMTGIQAWARNEQFTKAQKVTILHLLCFLSLIWSLAYPNPILLKYFSLNLLYHEIMTGCFKSCDRFQLNRMPGYQCRVS